MYSKKSYIEIGNILAETNANETQINKFVDKFSNDNPRFDEKRFREFIEKQKKTFTDINKFS